MARGSKIIVTDNPRGVFKEGIIASGQTPKPGTILQKTSASLVGGRHTWTAYSRDADGNHPAGALAVLLEDSKQGKTATEAYAAGDRCQLYCPLPGEELNLLFGNASGTADDIAVNDLMIVDSGTGKIIKTAGSPESEPAQALEAIDDPTADQLLWCEWTGY